MAQPLCPGHAAGHLSHTQAAQKRLQVKACLAHARASADTACHQRVRLHAACEHASDEPTGAWLESEQRTQLHSRAEHASHGDAGLGSDIAVEVQVAEHRHHHLQPHAATCRHRVEQGCDSMQRHTDALQQSQLVSSTSGPCSLHIMTLGMTVTTACSSVTPGKAVGRGSDQQCGLARLAVHAVGHAAMPRNRVAKVFDLEPALEAAGKEAAEGRDDARKHGQHNGMHLARTQQKAR